jgi:hypothetical protein
VEEGVLHIILGRNRRFAYSDNYDVSFGSEIHLLASADLSVSN